MAMRLAVFVHRSAWWLLGLLLGFELLGRVFFAQSVAGRFEYGFNPDAGFVVSDQGLDLVRAGGRRFFPQHLDLSDGDRRLRLFSVGDSVPRGKDVASSYVGQLGDLLAHEGVANQVLNLCLAGYGARRSQVVVRRALAFEPDVLLLHLNSSNEFEDEREWRRAQEFASWHPRNWLMKSVLFRRLYEYKLERMFWKWLPVEVRLAGAANDVDAELAAGRDATVVARWNARVASVSAQSVREAVDAGVRVLLVVQGNWDAASGTVVSPPGLEALAADLVRRWGPDGDGRARVAVLRMAEVLPEQQAGALFSDGSHLHRAGHALLAQAIAQRLRDLGWTQPVVRP